jgi:hypothetical protein
MLRVVVLMLLSACVTGCSSGGSLFGTSDSQPRAQATQGFGDRFMSLFGSGAERQTSTQPVGTPATEEVDCPPLSVREGAATLAVNGPGEPSAMNVRYQGTIGRLARECSVANKVMRMKVGIEGHLIVGPAGVPGKVDLPLRLAVVREGAVPQTIMTKTYRKEVMVEPGTGNVDFVQIDDDLSFPMPAQAADIENYVIYVGYDPLVPKKPSPRKPSRKRAAM